MIPKQSLLGFAQEQPPHATNDKGSLSVVDGKELILG